ncbi:GAF domain-containing protein [Chloroflexota bacterium]
MNKPSQQAIGKVNSSTLHPGDQIVDIFGGLDACLYAVIDSFQDELLVIDRDFRIRFANSAVLARHGKTRDQIIGKICYDISHGLPGSCQPPHARCPLKRVWDTGKPARDTHLHVYYANGKRKERYLDIIASPLTDVNGKVVAIAELMRDVTDTKLTELRLAESNRDLLALNAVTGAVCQSLDLDTVLSKALEKTLEIMNRNTGGILIWNEEKQMLCYRVHHGLSNDYAQGICLLPDQGIAGKVAKTGKPIMVNDISQDPRSAYPDLINAEGLKAFASIPLRSKNKVLGVLNIASHEARRFSRQDMQILKNVAAQIAIAIENARLHMEVRLKDDSRRQLLREIFLIQEGERKRIARELHDETCQSLASLAANLKIASGKLPAGREDISLRLEIAEKLSISILDEIHRLIYELRPTLLDDLGLVAAVRWLTEYNLTDSGITGRFSATGKERRLTPRLETYLFRIIQEAVTNMVKHSKARIAVVNIHFRRNELKIHISDDGVGFDVEDAIHSKDRPRGLGLLGMMERVEMLGGKININSKPVGGGTEIDIDAPLNREVKNG